MACCSDGAYINPGNVSKDHERYSVPTQTRRLRKSIQHEPFDGIGKPEPLKHNLSGLWSRRITAEHRLIYAIEEGEIRVAMCRYHY
ncbi:Txe/YoeB family addiction module toxin [Pseudomonas sp. ZT5P21]